MTVLGGETTVTLRGTGMGGRNQELAFARGAGVGGPPRLAVLVGGHRWARWPDRCGGRNRRWRHGRPHSGRRGRSASTFWANNDSYAALKLAGDLLVTGGHRHECGGYSDHGGRLIAQSGSAHRSTPASDSCGRHPCSNGQRCFRPGRGLIRARTPTRFGRHGVRAPGNGARGFGKLALLGRRAGFAPMRFCHDTA